MWIFLVLAIVPILYLYLTKNHGYWEKRGVPYFSPLPIFGNLKPLIMLNEAPGVFLGSLYNSSLALKQRFVGMFIFNSEPAVLLRDPELIKQVYVKDFAHFNNRNVECNGAHDPIGYNNLFVLRDQTWKYVRQKLSPVFTSGKIKQMFKLTADVADELLVHIGKRIKNGEKEIEVKDVAAKYTTDVISTCAFGILSNSLNDPKSIFREFGRKVFEMTIWRSIEVRAFFFMHGLAKIMKAVFLQKESTEFFRNVFWEAMDTREKTKQVRNDFLDTLLALKKDAEKKLSETADSELFEFDGDKLVAQSALFFVAGFETTATTISNCLAELSMAPEIQEKLREEILQYKLDNNGEIHYDALFEMKYLDKVVSETLRKYPPMPFIDRICTKDYKIPDSDVVIKEGTPVFVALYNGLHYDPEYWPKPQKFDPERFSEENKSTRHPFAYIPFGEGPHICIGMRFGLMSVKTALSRIIAKYRVEPTSQIEMPLKIDNRAIILTVQGGLTMKFSPVQS